MRVIGGTLKGRRLIAPRGMATRPTGDRVKESLFNILGDKVVGRHVLDLYAGSGALGIEAMSRGAVTAVFVDRAQAAIAVLRRNLHALDLENRSVVLRRDIRRRLNFLAFLEPPIDLVFMDPPYGDGAVADTLKALTSTGRLIPGTRLVVEHSVHEELPQSIAGLILSNQRRFGKTLVSFMDYML